MSVLVLVVCGFFGLTTVFIICELGQRMNNDFHEIHNTIDRLDWYLFPIKIQRMLPTIIANAQQPILLECFGSITCTRETFKKVSYTDSQCRLIEYEISLTLLFSLFHSDYSLRFFIFFDAGSI